jgi:hypothetical protein
MPTLTELKKSLKAALKDRHLNVETYARPLRAAGLLTTGGRGWSTPQVNPGDCARLLIAIMAPFPARHAVKTVKEYEALELRARPPGPRGRRSTRARVLRGDELAVLPLDRIKEVQVLGQLVEFLIRRASDGSLERLRASYQGEPGRPVLALRLVGPAKGAILELPMQPNRGGHNVGEQSSGGKAVLAYGPSGDSPSTPLPGLTRAAEIHEDTLIDLGRLFSAK